MPLLLCLFETVLPAQDQNRINQAPLRSRESEDMGAMERLPVSFLGHLLFLLTLPFSDKAQLKSHGC